MERVKNYYYYLSLLCRLFTIICLKQTMLLGSYSVDTIINIIVVIIIHCLFSQGI
jgi:hypothetical protein